MQIYGFNKSTLINYPKHLAATVFTGGCNMRCPFCHNGSLVLNPTSQPLIPISEVLSYLQKRSAILEGVCITGGEPTIHKDLPLFIKEIKSMGYKVKLDTNGSNPTVLHQLVEHHLVDYIAMDIKNGLEHYPITTGNTYTDFNLLHDSIQLLLSDQVDYEFRTTVVSELHMEEDIHSIGQLIEGAKVHYLQPYKDSYTVIVAGFHRPQSDTLLSYQSILKEYVQSVFIRDLD